MNSKFRQIVLWLLLLALLSAPLIQKSLAQTRPPWARGAVATSNPLASQAALGVLERGGNAIDAAIEAALTLGVVEGENSGIGGGCMMLIRLGGSGRIVAIDGRETAPLLSTPNMFLRQGNPDPQLSRTGALAVATPGALAAYAEASRLFGRRPFGELLLEAAALAERGFALDPDYARQIGAETNELNQFPAARALFFNADGSPKKAGDLLRQPDLAATYRAIARRGPAWFYGGPFAARVAEWMSQHGGRLTVNDFRRYRALLRRPILSTYRGFGIAGFPPPSSGGTVVAEILNIAERFDLKRFGPNTPMTAHIVSEAMKMAFADRALYLGDTDFVRASIALLISKRYAARKARAIRLNRTLPVAPLEALPAAQPASQHTTHFSVADFAGNWVACTATINTPFGSKVIVPGAGVLLNNEMDDFTAKPGATNSFELVSSAANLVAPGKRPLSSMSPTLVFSGGVPWMSLGAAGGPTIISQVALALIDCIDFGMDLPSALAQPRFHEQWAPDVLKVEIAAGEPLMMALRRLGHVVEPVPPFGATQGIQADLASGTVIGAADPRGHGMALGW